MTVAVGRLGLTVGPDDVGLPVIEVQLGGLADLFLGARGVVIVRAAHVDFVAAGVLDFGLRDTQLVDALAHDLDRAFQRSGSTLAAAVGLAW